MDIRNSASALDNFILQALRGQQNQTQGADASKPPPPPPSQSGGRDLVRVSSEANAQTPRATPPQQSQLVDETLEEIDNGFRRTQKFESAEGRQFTRIEEFTVTDARSKRTVIQQNNSGSTSILENILDRQDDGSFRKTERFTDALGETQTNIEFNVTPNNIDVVLGRPPKGDDSAQSRPLPPRGSTLDLSA